MRHWLKKELEHGHHYLLDALIVILVVIIFILADFFIISLRPLNEEAFEENQTEVSKNEKKEQERDFIVIEKGEKVFLPILNFHHIDKAPSGASAVTRSFYLEPADFEILIQAIINNDYEPVFLSEIVDYLSRGVLPAQKIMALTFDDGNINFYTNAWPILQKYQVKSNIYIMTGVGGPNYLSREQIAELDKSGLVEVGSHTIWHPKLTRIKEDEAFKELTESREFLEDFLDKKIAVLAYPFGLYNERIKELTEKAGYLAGLTFDQEAWQDPGDLLELKRISVYPGLNVIRFLEKLEQGR
ncbi:MAG TPA: polysaccharide deacetylase family protein [Candidatus Uhrbacteria bacterium]|nr:polysaccharide deacetylase family protein [Candidatus Uhrbacteria bacterium]